MASPTQWTWVWVNSGSWWWTGRPGILQSIGSQRVGHNWATEVNWTECQFMTIFEIVQKEDIKILSPLFLITDPDCKSLPYIKSSWGQEWWGYSSWVSSLLYSPLHWELHPPFYFLQILSPYFFVFGFQWSERTKILASNTSLPRKRSLVGSIPQGHKQSNMAEHSRLQSETESHSVVSDSLRPHGLYSPWNSPGQNTGVGSLSLLQGIFPTHGFYPGLPHCRQILDQLSQQGKHSCLQTVYRLQTRTEGQTRIVQKRVEYTGILVAVKWR